MKNTRRLLAVLLAVAMVLTCLPMTIFAAGKTRASAEEPAATEKALGFKSASFRASNSYQYADDELVRAIIVMEGKPAGEATGSRASAKARLAAQHESLRKSMSGLKYTELFEYDSLLNGLAVEAAYGDLDAISEMEGVKAVYIANRYELPVYDVKMESSNEMTGLAIAHQFGFYGSGTVIAILDTGMTAGHEAFAVYDGMLQSAAISKDDADAFIAGKGYGTYVSQKIPFSYDYADVDNDAEDSTNGHGPHVSGIAAGYAEAEDGAITFVGSAPDAQLLEMKIFNDISEGTSSDIYFAALEDAFELGADVINMSIGAQNGFTYDPELENEVYGNMYKILEDAGIVCSISAGNEYSMAYMASNWAGDGYVTADYADYGTLGSPATYDGNMSIASLENAAFPANILKVGDLEVAYYDSDEGSQFFNAMVGKEFNYVDCGFGYPEDFESVDVSGKIALVSRGDITFQEKVDNAAAAGAAAALVYNNAAGVIYMSIDPYAIPAASITQEDGLALLALLGSEEGGEFKGVKVGKEMRDTNKPAKRADDEYITGYWAQFPEDGDPVVLYSAKDGVILAYSATTEDDGTYYTAWNQNTEAATVDGTKLTADWMDAGILYALDMGDGTWAFVDEYEYDYNDETWLLMNDGTFVGTYGDPEYDGDLCFYELELTTDGCLFKNVGSELYLMIKNGMFYDTADASEATVLSFYVISDEDPEDPPIVPPVGEGDDFTRADSLVDGTEVIIYNPDSGKALSAEAISTYYKAGVDVTPVDDVITTDNADIVWKIAAADGGFYIYNDQGKLSSDGTYNSIPYDGSNDIWHLAEADGGVYVVNNADKYLEWGAAHDDFTCYTYSDDYAAAMTMQIFVKGEPIVPPDPPVDPDAPVMTFPEEKAIVANADGWFMSDYSCWGATPSLTLKPTITGVGGDVNSVLNNSTDEYTIYSGTSMAAPNVSGYMAVLLGYLMENNSGIRECPSEPYADVDQSRWYHEAVDYVISEGYMGSTSTEDLTFEPDTNVSRSMVASILYRICGSKPVEYTGRFTDVPEGKWFTAAIEWCAQNGLASGKEDGSVFDPNGNVTRQELAVFMYNLAKYLGKDVSGAADLSTFADGAKVPAWSAPYLAWAVDAGIISGQANDGKTNLNPTAGALRCELASILMRFMGGSYKEGEVELTKPERAAKAEALAESTAMILEDADSYIYSPRKQGSGLIDIVSALNAEAYILDPIQNLFDSVDGEWEFTFTVKNEGAAEKTFAVTPVAMYDYADYADWSEEEDGSDVRWYNTLTAHYLDDCIDAPETVTVPAGGTADVTVKITLTADAKEFFDDIYPNGNYIEGYVVLTPDDEEDVEIHATYMGFYGDWTKAPVMEQHDWREVVELDTWLQTTAADDEGYTYADYGYTYLDIADFEVNTDINLAYALNYMYLEYYGQLMGGYAGDNLFAYADSFNEKHIAISEGPDGICDTLYMMPMNLRNCRHMIMVVSNAETGEVYYVDDTEYLPKAIYDTDYGYWSNTGTFIWDGTDADGDVLPSDTVVDINYYCNIAYGEDALYTGAARDENGMVIPEDFVKYANMKADASDYLEWNFRCTVDNDAPEFTYEYDEATQTLTVTATDNQYLAVIDLYQGDELIDEAVFSEDEAGKTCTAVFENVPSDTMYELDVADYASNIVAEDVILGDVETATVKFVFPEGFELDDMDAEITVPVGSTIVLPYLYGEVDGAYYVAWLTEALEETISGEDLDSDEYAWIWDILYFEDDEAVITEDTTFYAVFERVTGYADPSEELALNMSELADWSGVWAFNGYDWTAADDASSDYFMTSDLSAFYLDYDNEDEWVEYGYFGDGYLYGAPEDQLFTIENIGLDTDDYGTYTIKTADGKYIAITADGELTLVDEASDAYATWDIWLDPDMYVNIVWNHGADFVLMFDEDTHSFASVSVDEAMIDEPNNLYMFGLSASSYEYFTAK